MSHASRRHIMLPALLATACVFVGYVTVFVAQRRGYDHPKRGIILVPCIIISLFRNSSRSNTIQEE